MPRGVRAPWHHLAMFDLTTLALFAAAGVALLIIPGPSVLFIITRSIDQGPRAGLISVAGIHVGTMGHIAAGVVGISATVARSATAFSVVKFAGAAYLITLGVLRLVRRDTLSTGATRTKSDRQIFVQAFFVNLLNPKTALFFLAFLPQFVDPARGSVPVQTLMLGAIFIALGLVTDSTYALVAGSAGSWMRRSSNMMRLQRWLAGSMYVALGVTAAGAHARRT
jgi:threonine/homoserine/homoserine lactone efflux protein